MIFTFRPRRLAVCALALFSLALTEGRSFQRGSLSGRSAIAEGDDDIQLPNGKSQRDEILKLEREQNIKDAAQLAQLAEDLKVDLEKNDRFVFSLNTLKKTDDIEKLAKKIRSRMRHN
jgi:hypothetical protein